MRSRPMRLTQRTNCNGSRGDFKDTPDADDAHFNYPIFVLTDALEALAFQPTHGIFASKIMKIPDVVSSNQALSCDQGFQNIT